MPEWLLYPLLALGVFVFIGVVELAVLWLLSWLRDRKAR